MAPDRTSTRARAAAARCAAAQPQPPLDPQPPAPGAQHGGPPHPPVGPQPPAEPPAQPEVPQPRRPGRVTIASLQAQLVDQQEQSRLQVQALQEQLQQALNLHGQGGQQPQRPDPGFPPVPPLAIIANQGPQQDGSNDRVADLEAQLAELRDMRAHNAPVTFAGAGYPQLPFNVAAPGQWPAPAPVPFGGAYQAPQGFPQMQMAWNGALPTGGEYEISRHYTALTQGDLEKMMMGNLNPAKIFQAIPSDSVLYPVVETTEKGGRLEYDPSSNQLTISDAGPAHICETNLKRLIKTLDHPIKFALAWTWFVTITGYKYRDPDLSAAMMRFGWKVVSYALTNDWSTVLRVFVELATPLLTGNLLRCKADFDSVSFAEALGPYRTNSTVQPISALGNTIAYPNASTSANTATTSSAAKPAIKAERPVCRRFNRNECDGLGCKFQHVCQNCGQVHPSIFCASNMRAAAYLAQPSTYAAPGPMMGQPQYQPQQHAFQGAPGFSGYQTYGQNQGTNQAFGYPQPAAYPQQQAFGAAPPGQSQQASSSANKARGFGSGQGRGGQT